MVRVGVVNLMPRLETYEPSLRALFAAAGVPVSPVWIRLRTHVYRSSDPVHLAANYVDFDAALAEGPLDGLLLTGAPVEHLPVTEVRYWPELDARLRAARSAGTGILGICWGAMALAEQAGLSKDVYPRKVFGQFEHRTTRAASDFLGLSGAGFVAPQSRFAGFSSAEVDRAERAGLIRLLADARGAGPTLLATPDASVFMHLGHPEYDLDRLGYEWARDRAAGRTDVDPPVGYVNDAPTRDWRPDSAAFMRAWLRRLRRG